MNKNKEVLKIFIWSIVMGFVVLIAGFLIQNYNIDNMSSLNYPENFIAQSDYVPLSGSGPESLFESNDTERLDIFLNNLFEWGIAIALILAVLFIVLGSVEYMTTDAVFKKEEGIKKITAALAGLILALVSWVILNQINPNLLNMDITIVGQEASRYAQQRINNPENFNTDNDVEISSALSPENRDAIIGVRNITGANTLVSGRDIRERAQRMSVEENITFEEAQAILYESIRNGTYGDITTFYSDPGIQNDSFIDNYRQEVWGRVGGGVRSVGGFLYDNFTWWDGTGWGNLISP
jgi:hypothetical protein